MIYRGEPITYAPNTVETPESVQHRLDYYDVACLVIDAAYDRFGPKKAEAA